MLAFQSQEVLSFTLIMYSSGICYSDDSREKALESKSTIAYGNGAIGKSSIVLYIDKCLASHVNVEHTIFLQQLLV